MPYYYFHLVNVVHVGPNPEWDDDYSGAFVSCIVRASDKVTATEMLISAFQRDGFFYEAVEEVMEIAEAIERLGKERINPENQDLDALDEINIGDFFMYRKTT